MITWNDLLGYIESELGAPYQVLELSKEDLYKIIEKETIKTYSSFYPYLQNIIVDPSVDYVVSGMTREVEIGIFYLKPYGELEIIGITKLLPLVTDEHNSYYRNTTLIGIDPLSAKIFADGYSMYSTPETFDFIPPNKIEIFPKVAITRKFTVQISAIHPITLHTLPLEHRDIFFELALLDVRRKLFPIRKKFSTLETPFGSIELFMEKLDSAESDRKELIEKLRSDFHKHYKRKKIFVY